MHASGKGGMELVEELVRHRADINIKDKVMTLAHPNSMQWQ
jgi:hypothetical protein